MLSKIANAKVFFNPTGNQNVINTTLFLSSDGIKTKCTCNYTNKQVELT